MGMSTGDRNRNGFFRNSALVFIRGNSPAFFQFPHLIPCYVALQLPPRLHAQLSWLLRGANARVLLPASVTLRALSVLLRLPHPRLCLLGVISGKKSPQ